MMSHVIIGRLTTTYWPVRVMFQGVLLSAASPRTKRRPSHHTDETADVFCSKSEFWSDEQDGRPPEQNRRRCDGECDMAKSLKSCNAKWEIHSRLSYSAKSESVTFFKRLSSLNIDVECSGRKLLLRSSREPFSHKELHLNTRAFSNSYLKEHFWKQNLYANYNVAHHMFLNTSF